MTKHNGMHAWRALRRSALAAAVVATLSACGGGGGDTVRPEVPPPVSPPPTTPPPTPPPTVVQPPNPAYSRHLELTNAYPALDAGLTGEGIVIGVIDSGVNRNHPSLRGRVVDNLVYVNRNINDMSVDDKDGHGTAVAQVIAGGPFGEWPGGLAQGASIVSARIINDEPPEDDGSGDGNPVSGALGLEPIHNDLIARGMRIMNNSWGGLYWNDANATAPIAAEYRRFITQTDGLVVFAAGNRDPDSNDSMALTDMAGLPSQAGPNDSRPAADLERGWLAVVAVDTDNPSQLASFSRTCAYARSYCLAAPGTVIVTGTNDAPDDPEYWRWRGTSFAAPQVSGAAALVWEAFPYFNNDLVRQTLLGTATDIGEAGVDDVFGYGLLDVGKAIQGPGRFDWGRVTVDFDGLESDWSNDIAGAGGLTKRGDGRLVLTGDNTYRGDTRVEEGTLWVGGALRDSDVAIASAGTLGGGGRVDGNVDNQGTMALDAGNGFSIGGNYVQGADARLAVTLGHGALQVQGNASLDGTVHVAGARQGYVTRDREEILRVAGTRSGFFDGVTYDANRVFFQGSVSYDFESVWLNITRLDVQAAASAMGNMTPAALSAAERVEGAFRQIDGQLDAGGRGPIADGFIRTAGDFQSLADANTARTALSSLSGELHALASSATFDHVDIGRRALSSQLSGSLERPQAVGGWQKRLGAGGEGGFAAGQSSFDGWLLGQDFRLADGTIAGFAFGEMQADSRRADSRDRGQDRQVQAQMFAGKAFGNAHVLGQAGVGRFDRELRRDLYTGAQWSGVHSNYAGDITIAAIEGGYRFDLGADGRLTPYLGAEYTRIDSDGFRELGAEGFGLRTDAWTSSRSQAIAGLRGAWELSRFSVHGYAEWQHTLSAQGLDIDASFVGVDAWSALRGLQPGRSGGLFGIGIDAWAGRDARVNFGYDQRFGPRGDDRMLSMRYVKGFW